MSIETLEWDSAFFNLTIGKAQLAEGSSTSLRLPEEFDLVYLFVTPHDRHLNELLVKAGGFLADEKVTYVKRLRKRPESPRQVISYKRRNAAIDGEVVRIGIQSGRYSRFNRDLHFKRGAFESLYTVWMNRSIDREIAKEVYVYEKEGAVCGVITLREVADRSDIGILAVDTQTRGLGVGRKLIQQAEAFCWDNQHKELQVVTQKANHGACRFYEQCGFVIEKVVNVYHFWKE